MINLRKNNYSIFKTIFIILIFISFNLFAKEEKFTGIASWFYETPTRYIIIVDGCEGSIACDKITYYEINKQTGKSLKLKGETINIGPDLDFRGYDFDYKDLNYRIILQGEPSFIIIENPADKKNHAHTILEEPIIQYHMDFSD